MNSTAAPSFARLFAPEHIADPHPYLKWLRENEPVLRGPEGDYLVSTYAGCAQVFDPTLFRAAEGPDLFPAGPRSRTFELLTGTIAMRNPPEHTRLRKLFTRDFTVRRVEALREPTARTCAMLLDAITTPLRDGATVDLVGALTKPLPVQVISEMVGIAPADRARLFGLVPDVLSTLVPGVDAEVRRRGDEASSSVETYYRELVAARRAEPRQDLTSAWLQGHQDERLTFDELLSMLWGMIAGGLATTSSALASAIVALLRFGGEPDRGFADEVLRHESPSFIGGVPKIALREVEIGGVVIEEGAVVRTMLTSAGRDAAEYTDPDRFDPLRDNSRTLAFGHGMHLCIGANLARMQLTTLLPLLRERFPALELAGEPEWQPPTPVRGISRLPVRLGG